MQVRIKRSGSGKEAAPFVYMAGLIGLASGGAAMAAPGAGNQSDGWWQGHGLLLGTVLFAVLAFLVAWRMRRAATRQESEDGDGNESDEASAGEVASPASQPAASSMATASQDERLARARAAFEKQLSAIDLDLDTPPATESRGAKPGTGPQTPEGKH